MLNYMTRCSRDGRMYTTRDSCGVRIKPMHHARGSTVEVLPHALLAEAADPSVLQSQALKGEHHDRLARAYAAAMG